MTAFPVGVKVRVGVVPYRVGLKLRNLASGAEASGACVSLQHGEVAATRRIGARTFVPRRGQLRLLLSHGRFIHGLLTVYEESSFFMWHSLN